MISSLLVAGTAFLCLSWSFVALGDSPSSELKVESGKTSQFLVPRLEPGNAKGEAEPLVFEGGRASKKASPVRAWEREGVGDKTPRKLTNGILKFRANSSSPF